MIRLSVQGCLWSVWDRNTPLQANVLSSSLIVEKSYHQNAFKSITSKSYFILLYIQLDGLVNWFPIWGPGPSQRSMDKAEVSFQLNKPSFIVVDFGLIIESVKYLINWPL